MTSRFTEEQQDRFWRKVACGRKKDCWLWKLGCTKAGYGQLQIRAVASRPLLAHRVAWELTNGAIPDGLHILHRCDNPRCCNPHHLFLGTQRDNNRDRDKKGRVASGDQNGARTRPDRNPFVRNRGSGMSGEKHPQAKLSDKDVAALLAEKKSGISNAALARKYEISQTHVGRIVRGTSRKTKKVDRSR